MEVFGEFVKAKAEDNKRWDDMNGEFIPLSDNSERERIIGWIQGWD